MRVVIWSTGGVGSIAIDGVRRRPDLELVGVWVHSPDKVGKGAGELAATAMRVVNAIPYVVEAAPGLLSSLDIPTTLPLYTFD